MIYFLVETTSNSKTKEVKCKVNFTFSNHVCIMFLPLELRLSWRDNVIFSLLRLTLL